MKNSQTLDFKMRVLRRKVNGTCSKAITEFIPFALVIMGIIIFYKLV